MRCGVGAASRTEIRAGRHGAAGFHTPTYPPTHPPRALIHVFVRLLRLRQLAVDANGLIMSRSGRLQLRGLNLFPHIPLSRGICTYTFRWSALVSYLLCPPPAPLSDCSPLRQRPAAQSSPHHVLQALQDHVHVPVGNAGGDCGGEGGLNRI